MTWLLRMVACLLASGGPIHACGPASDCALGDRVYRIHLPGDVESPGAIVFAHGYRGSAAGTMGNAALIELAERLGVALVAAQSFADDWRIPGVPANPATDGAEEIAYFEALVPALAERHGIDTDRMLLTGFSAGGMMTWQLACARGALFAGYAPIAGTFWAPIPDTCPGAPVHLFHTHGSADTVVPMAGRAIGPTRQGNLLDALDLLRDAGGYANAVPFAAEDMTCTRETGRGRHVLELCVHDGGHSLRAAFIARAWYRLNALGAL